MSKKFFACLGLLILVVISFVYSQIPYQFLDNEGNRDMQAYWYNVPQDVVKPEGGGEIYMQSALHLYGQAPAEDFQVRVQAFLRNKKKVYENVFDVKKSVKLSSIEIRSGFFKIAQPVEFLPERPDQIVLTVKSEKSERTKHIICRYHKLSGKITDFDGKPVKAYIAVCPDAFAGDHISKRSDDLGNFDVWLPERTYNAVIANTEQYGTSRLEAWAWHVIMDTDQTVDFKIGNGEVYNLHAWANNGGGSNYFITFRPMALPLSRTPRKYSVRLSGQEIPIFDTAPDLTPDNIKVIVNGQELEFISLQKFYETVTKNDGLPHYLVQVLRKGPSTFGKQTVVVEYDTEVEIDGKKTRICSMGLFQFYLNFYGLSEYF